MRHILVVDDEQSNRLFLMNTLREHYTVHGVSGGQRALDYLQELPRVDLILLDVDMPDMHGFEVCRLIKAVPELQGIPVLMLDNPATLEDEARGFALGAEDFIHKPFSPVLLLARIRNHLEFALTRRLLRERTQELTLARRVLKERSQELRQFSDKRRREALSRK